MQEFIRIETDDLQLATNVKVLKRNRYQIHLKAQEVIDTAQLQAKQIATQAQQQREEEKQRGYSDGLNEAKKEQGQALVETLILCERYIQSSKQEIAEIVLSAVRKIVDDFDNQQLVLKTIRQSMKSVANSRQAILRVSPLQEELVKQSLGDLLGAFPEMSDVDVISDDRVNPGGCLLETQAGVLDGTIENQLLAIETAVKNQFSENENICE